MLRIRCGFFRSPSPSNDERKRRPIFAHQNIIINFLPATGMAPELNFRGARVNPKAIRRTMLLTVEGERDDLHRPDRRRARAVLRPSPAY